MKTYRRGETPKIYANVYAESMSTDGVLTLGDLTEPSNMYIWMRDSAGSQIALETTCDRAAMTGTSGQWTYNAYTIPETANLGVWSYECQASDASGYTATGYGTFKVEEQAST